MTATQALALLLFILGSCAIAGLARRRGVAAPILLVLAGLAASYIPGVPVFRLQPDVILFVVLPPLVYTTALESSYLNLRDNLRTLALLSVGLVLFTALVVGGAAWLAVPGLSLAAAFTLGAILSPTDAVTTASIGRQLHLPRRLLTVINGESMLNDGTALTVYAVAVSAAATTVATPSPLEDVRSLLVIGPAGWPSAWCSGWCCTGSGCGCATRWWRARCRCSPRSPPTWPPIRCTCPGSWPSW